MTAVSWLDGDLMILSKESLVPEDLKLNRRKNRIMEPVYFTFKSSLILAIKKQIRRVNSKYLLNRSG